MRNDWIFVILIVMIVGELLMGRKPVPPEMKLWGGTVDGSRQLFDWYSPSHISHGFIFYWLTGSLVAATAIEAAWELLENSPVIIRRYRQTSSVDYAGDTILNSVSDLTCMMAGFCFAEHMPWQATIGIAVFFELFTLWAIRDNLTLNVVMLVHPWRCIKRWQQKGGHVDHP